MSIGNPRRAATSLAVATRKEDHGGAGLIRPGGHACTASGTGGPAAQLVLSLDREETSLPAGLFCIDSDDGTGMSIGFKSIGQRVGRS
jgi:hypothetical protein